MNDGSIAFKTLRRALAAAAGASLLWACSNGSDGPSVPAWSLPAATPPLAASARPDERSSVEVAPGITQHTLTIGTPSASDGFEVNVGFVRSQADADPLFSALRVGGLSTKFVQSADARTGYMVRIDARYATAAQADAAVAAVRALALPPSTQSLAVGVGRVYTAEDGTDTSGPYRIDLLAIRPSFGGTIQAALGTDVVPGRETTTALAARKGALAAINGGYFAVGSANGTEGDLAGLSVIDGRLVSEGVEGRPALFLERINGVNTARIERKLSTLLTVTAAGQAPRRIDGINRKPGLNTNCGNPTDRETSIAVHDVVCTDANEIVVYTSDFGPTTSTDVPRDVVEAVIDAQGIVTAVSAVAGSPIAPGGRVLQGIGEGARWLSATLRPGQAVSVTPRLITAEGSEIALRPGLYGVNGGPTLLVHGAEVDADHAAEGWGNADVAGVPFTYANGNRANFFNGFYLRRNPRTAVGVAADGTILMLVSDGRAPQYSVGLSVPETARVLKHFGAVSAINLDGGGSSMMVVSGKPQTLPSDANNVERPDGDGILIFK